MALTEFAEAVDATGGVRRDAIGGYCPVGDLEWIDLGEAHVHACRALGRTPRIDKHNETMEAGNGENT